MSTSWLCVFGSWVGLISTIRRAGVGKGMGDGWLVTCSGRWGSRRNEKGRGVEELNLQPVRQVRSS